ncbi:barstar family protein [Sphingobium sp.]|uniref:barstar family protein n=1 Tax=Sphingobium sp. TaxID=1912891 RepID=UPI0035C74266
MNVVNLDAQHWQTPDDFYKALLRKLGAPDWHGHNIAALIDSMIVGDINEVELPLRVVVIGLDRASETAFDELISAFGALARYGAVANITSDHASIEIADGVSPYLTGQPDS